MYGWRLSIGLIVSSPDATMEAELRRTLPEGVEFYTARVRLPRVPHPYADREVEPFLARLTESGKNLADAGVDLILFGCTGATFSRGAEWNREIGERLGEAAGVPAYTASSAVVEALGAVSGRRVMALTPYPQGTNDCLRRFLAENGVETVGIRTISLAEIYAAPELLHRAARQCELGQADALFISCTGVRTIEVLARLESDLGKPVISSNVACLWYSLRKGGIKDPLPGLGTLLTEH